MTKETLSSIVLLTKEEPVNRFLQKKLQQEGDCRGILCSTQALEEPLKSRRSKIHAMIALMTEKYLPRAQSKRVKRCSPMLSCRMQNEKPASTKSFKEKCRDAAPRFVSLRVISYRLARLPNRPKKPVLWSAHVFRFERGFENQFDCRSRRQEAGI